jgi:predicted AAA+ superfamily ATPase
VNFDDERLAEPGSADALLAAVDEVYGQPQHLLLDEIQNLPRWELLANRLQRQGRRLVVTGSNANLLSSELATHLTGRHQPILVFPFSFAELVRLQGRALTEAERHSLLDRYAGDGGMPEPWVTGVQRTEYLRTLVHSVLYKDIVRRFGVRAVQGLEDLARYLCSNVAKEFSYRTLTQVTRCRSVQTVERYVRHLEEAFLVFTLRRFSFRVREQAAFNKKAYAVDTGVASALGFRPGLDDGRLWENLVAIALRRRELRGGPQVCFWRNVQGEEVDFVVREGLAVTALVQVCRDVADPRTRSREVRALLKAGAELRCRHLLVLNDSEEREEEAQWFGTRGRIRYVPLAKWLETQDCAG